MKNINISSKTIATAIVVLSREIANYEYDIQEGDQGYIESWINDCKKAIEELDALYSVAVS